jgi:hypothetical protein
MGKGRKNYPIIDHIGEESLEECSGREPIIETSLKMSLHIGMLMEMIESSKTQESIQLFSD